MKDTFRNLKNTLPILQNQAGCFGLHNLYRAYSPITLDYHLFSCYALFVP